MEDSLLESGRLSAIGILRFAGPDAAAFLQGQLSQDTRRLQAGAPLLAAYSSPQGRVVALPHLLPHSSGIMALMPREIILPTLERLRRFVLRAKVRIEDVSQQFDVVGQHGPHALLAAGLSVPDATPGYAEHDGIGVATVEGRAPSRYWVVGTPEALLARHGLLGDIDAAARIERDWRLADIRAGMPQVYAATREMFVAQMLNLDLIDGISFTKGCFTGQEIIARTQHLGRIKRRLHRLGLPAGTWAIGQAIHLADGRSGRVTELAPVGDGYEALAVLTAGAAVVAAEAGAGADAAEPPSDTPRIDATELPLPYSLDRPAA